MSFLDKDGLQKFYNGIKNIFALKSHMHTKSQITDFPTSLKNPSSLTIQTNGTTVATYDGSTEKTVDIIPSDIGAANITHNHTSSEITDMPNSLPNPSALTLQLGANNSYSYNGSHLETVSVAGRVQFN